jgi:hypothetical protein
VDYYALTELEVYSGVTNVALNRPISALGVLGGERHYSTNFVSSYAVDGNTNTSWASFSQGACVAVAVRGNNLKFTDLRVIGFGTKTPHECFPFYISVGSPMDTNALHCGNVLVENCEFAAPATNNTFNVTVLSLYAFPPFTYSNAVIRNCRVMDFRSAFVGVQAFSASQVENSYVTNCDVGVYFEPALPGAGAPALDYAIIRSNRFDYVAAGVVSAFHNGASNQPQLRFGNLIIEKNEIILSPAFGLWAVFVTDAVAYHGITSNMVVNGNSIHFPNWETNHVGTGLTDNNALNAVFANNLIEISPNPANGQPIYVVYDPPLSGTTRAFYNNTNLVGTTLGVWKNPTSVNVEPAEFQQWPKQ